MDMTWLGSATRADYRAHDAFRMSRPANGASLEHGGSELVYALECAWLDIKTRHPELPAVHMITGSGLTRGALVLGHFARDRWLDAVANNRRPEMFIGGETMAMGADLVLETMLHEAAHGLAAQRDITDCSRQNRYHNGKFRALAGELGLAWPDGKTPDSVIGYSHCKLTALTRASYRTTLTKLTAALTLNIPRPGLILTGGGGVGGDGGRLPGGRGGGRGGAQRVRLVCKCAEPRIIYASAKTYDYAAIRCEACEGEFLSAADGGTG